MPELFRSGMRGMGFGLCGEMKITSRYLMKISFSPSNFITPYLVFLMTVMAEMTTIDVLALKALMDLVFVINSILCNNLMTTF